MRFRNWAQTVLYEASPFRSLRNAVHAAVHGGPASPSAPAPVLGAGPVDDRSPSPSYGPPAYQGQDQASIGAYDLPPPADASMEPPVRMADPLGVAPEELHALEMAAGMTRSALAFAEIECAVQDVRDGTAVVFVDPEIPAVGDGAPLPEAPPEAYREDALLAPYDAPAGFVADPDPVAPLLPDADVAGGWGAGSEPALGGLSPGASLTAPSAEEMSLEERVDDALRDAMMDGYGAEPDLDGRGVFVPGPFDVGE